MGSDRKRCACHHPRVPLTAPRCAAAWAVRELGCGRQLLCASANACYLSTSFLAPPLASPRPLPHTHFGTSPSGCRLRLLRRDTTLRHAEAWVRGGRGCLAAGGWACHHRRRRCSHLGQRAPARASSKLKWVASGCLPSARWAGGPAAAGFAGARLGPGAQPVQLRLTKNGTASGAEGRLEVQVGGQVGPHSCRFVGAEPCERL